MASASSLVASGPARGLAITAISTLHPLTSASQCSALGFDMSSMPEVDVRSPIDDGGSHICDGCYRCYSSSGALVTHRNHCEQLKRKTAGILNNVSPAMLARRKRNLMSVLEEPHKNQFQLPLVPMPASVPQLPAPRAPPALPCPSGALVPPVLSDPPTATNIARPRRENIHLPERYRDNGAPSWVPRPRKHVDALPEPLISESTSSDLDPSHPPESSHAAGLVESEAVGEQQRVEVPPARTKCNVFGLYRQYRTKCFPTHDPEAAVDRELLFDPVNDPTVLPPLEVTTPGPCPPSDAPSTSPPDPADLPSHRAAASSTESTLSPFHPYPNWSSFHLGQWY
ncbi:hypothetical protein LXA43DRAFT_1104141 [Ganoderma leucocontextum]|nr:hypothetical protein LXA43DRAFT_1104141 [Ganoderma leucocontextum]